ncbi:hypothetical protein FIBSPDRAFT_849984 [Athelia psychrophila]|uniref:Uncharacterized protein n=1 Tax=Athelia psychrophila TaxID=1759441 RepID=A0A166TT91_9AGAM|nr:hypothetical protein FIBSPDRAFT_849984 [Fibularhizoctonia sp. CBS 109695]
MSQRRLGSAAGSIHRMTKHISEGACRGPGESLCSICTTQTPVPTASTSTHSAGLPLLGLKSYPSGFK